MFVTFLQLLLRIDQLTFRNQYSTVKGVRFPLHLPNENRIVRATKVERLLKTAAIFDVTTNVQLEISTQKMYGEQQKIFIDTD